MPQTGGRRTKTRATNKLSFNMKTSMNCRFQRDVVISVEDSFDEEEKRSFRIKQQISGALKNIEDGI